MDQVKKGDQKLAINESRYHQLFADAYLSCQVQDSERSPDFTIRGTTSEGLHLTLQWSEANSEHIASALIVLRLAEPAVK